MKELVKRVFVEKKDGFDVEANKLFNEFKNIMGIKDVKKVRVLNRYDIQGLLEDEYELSKRLILSEPPIDNIFEDKINYNDKDKIVCIEYLPGQYDQRADSAIQCIQIVSGGQKINVKTAKVIIISGLDNEDDYKKIKDYCINPVESREANMEKPVSLDEILTVPDNVEILEGFTSKSDSDLETFLNVKGLAMSFEDLKFCQEYFKTENREPTITEIKLIDTYWSDHCRHTTFLTKIKDVDFGNGYYSEIFQEIYEMYKKSRKIVYGDKKNKDICLMDIATIAMKELRKEGKLDDLEISDEINACSITVDVNIDGEIEEWLVMFKNETHNHPTEIEPFGGAATCLGGAIRDPLSGRSYVYQAMRVTGSGDPRTSIKDTLAGKLPQRKITKGAAEGYSSYGNQIGLATGQVHEIYDEGYIAKRMEIGAVIAAAPKENVKRLKPEKDDVIVLLGGRTGRDGCGGATGSSKEHDEDSLNTCGAEVQKGNPPTERKIQRLFRKSEVSKLIKKCNDFGAGGVSVAVGELADSLYIDLDKVPKKYEGLDGTELAISESQERMAVVIDKDDLDKFIEESKKENLEAVKIAYVTDNGRLVMNWKGKTIVDLKRDFLDTNGVMQETFVKILEPDNVDGYFNNDKKENNKTFWLENLKKLNVCSQKGLVEMFDSTIGAGSVLMPFGGKYQLSPADGMAAKIPVLKGNTTTTSLMSFGYSPELSKLSPFHGAVYAVVESVVKIVAMGGSYNKVRLTLQEYFEKLGSDKEKWGKPFIALLGAFYAQKALETPAIGGKDSMSGTFKDLDVPPTLVSFAVGITDSNKVLSTEFKNEDSKAIYIKVKRDKYNLPDFDYLKEMLSKISKLNELNKIKSAITIKSGGIAEAISKMSFGNKIGFKFNNEIKCDLYSPDYGSLVVEVDENLELDDYLKGIEYEILGNTIEEKSIIVNNENIKIDEMINSWTGTIENIFPTSFKIDRKMSENSKYKTESIKSKIKIAKPKVFIPVFPGTNCEYDTRKAFENAGAKVSTFVFRNMSKKDIDFSIKEIVNEINNSQIIMIPGGFSLGDEPDGSGKFIAAVFRNSYVKEAVNEFLKVKDGLMLGICNGFQALIKLGLLPYGEICDMDSNSPTLTYNSIGRHVSCMVNTMVVSNKSPWFNNVSVGDVHVIPVSHGEGRFIANEEWLKKLYENGQVATKYVDGDGQPTFDTYYNPNGSIDSIEGIVSPDGRILGKMGHSERMGENVHKNVPGKKDQKLFLSGVEYFS